jgi:hypothetical protein
VRPSRASAVFLFETTRGEGRPADLEPRIVMQSKTQELETQNTPEQQASAGCCGGAAPEGADACCVLDAEVKAEGGAGCGCSTSAAAPKKRCC